MPVCNRANDRTDDRANHRANDRANDFFRSFSSTSQCLAYIKLTTGNQSAFSSVFVSMLRRFVTDELDPMVNVKSSSIALVGPITVTATSSTSTSNGTGNSMNDTAIGGIVVAVVLALTGTLIAYFYYSDAVVITASIAYRRGCNVADRWLHSVSVSLASLCCLASYRIPGTYRLLGSYDSYGNSQQC